MNQPSRPNIVLVLMDDLGWRDLGCYGSTFYETPNLDRLAAEGMHFTDAYAACPVCSPTRASILSGKYPATIGLTNFIDVHGKAHPSRGRLIDAPYVKCLPLSEKSIASALRESGYHTWHIGKWHLGKQDTWPESHGFDVNIAGCDRGHPSTYFSPYNISTLSDGPRGEYLTDRLTDEAIRLIRQTRDGRPFFLNLWHYAVHIPIQAPADLVEKYKAKARAMGLDQVQALIEGEPFPTEARRHLRVQRRVLQSDPAYAAMIENLDWNIGRLMAALRDSGNAENTIVIFTSDNGGLSTAEGSPTCNRPLAEGKGWMYEGGTREPLIVHWPGRVEAGRVCSVPVTSPDFYPTFLEIAGLEARPAQHSDGMSFGPLLRGETNPPRGAIYWHYPHYGNQGGTPGSSVRRGDWKLIEFFETGQLELYNLRQDISEVCNLADEQPELADELHQLLRAWRDRVDAKIPAANPEFCK